MSVTARSLLLIGAFLALLVSQYAVGHALGHEIAFMAYPNIVPEPSLFDHPLLCMALVVITLAAFLEQLIADPIPLEGWIRPFAPAYRGQHFAYLCVAAMASLALVFVFVSVQASSFLQEIFWWTVLVFDVLFGVVVLAYVIMWFLLMRRRPLPAE